MLFLYLHLTDKQMFCIMINVKSFTVILTSVIPNLADIAEDSMDYLYGNLMKIIYGVLSRVLRNEKKGNK